MESQPFRFNEEHRRQIALALGIDINDETDPEPIGELERKEWLAAKAKESNSIDLIEFLASKLRDDIEQCRALPELTKEQKRLARKLFNSLRRPKEISEQIRATCPDFMHHAFADPVLQCVNRVDAALPPKGRPITFETECKRDFIERLAKIWVIAGHPRPRYATKHDAPHVPSNAALEFCYFVIDCAADAGVEILEKEIMAYLRPKKKT